MNIVPLSVKKHPLQLEDFLNTGRVFAGMDHAFFNIPGGSQIVSQSPILLLSRVTMHPPGPMFPGAFFGFIFQALFEPWEKLTPRDHPYAHGFKMR